jgi:hypothetical protein
MTTDGINQGGSGSELRKGLAVLALVVAVGVVPGCIIDGGSPGVCSEGEIRTSWILTNSSGPVQCLPGDTVSVQVDDQSMIKDFACSAFGGPTPAVQGGVVHVLTYTLADGGGNVLATAGPISISVPCGASVAAPQIDFPVP